MSMKTPYIFNRREMAQIVSPDPDTLAMINIDTDKKIDSGIWVDIEGNLANAGKTRQWAGIVIEPNYFTAAQTIMKPSGNVEAFFGDMRIATKQFTDDANAPIKAGDTLTLIDGKPAKPDDNNNVILFQVVSRGTDYIEIVTL